MQQGIADDFIQGIVPADILDDADGLAPVLKSPAAWTPSVSP